MTEPATRRAQKPRDVDYTLEIVDDLPDMEVQRRSPLTDQLERIVATPDSHGKFVRIASYANASAASAAANVLRQKHGKTESVDGWTIRPKRSDRTDPETGAIEPRTGLFVRYNPDAIVPGAKEEWVLAVKQHKEDLASKRVERDKARTKGNKRTEG